MSGVTGPAGWCPNGPEPMVRDMRRRYQPSAVTQRCSSGPAGGVRESRAQESDVTSRRLIMLQPQVRLQASSYTFVKQYSGLQTGPESIPLRVSRREEALLVELHLPGVSEDNVVIEVTDQILTVEAVRAPMPPDTEELWSDITTGRLRRQLHLPFETDLERATARYEDGVLRIAVPFSTTHGGAVSRRPEGPPVGEPEDDPGDDLPP